MRGLNPPQLQAVETTEGPVLVLAGAGTGKTRALTARLSHILLQGKARPSEVLSVTFTNRAAREMRGRVEQMIGRPTEGMWLGTFHAMSARILRGHAELVGLQPNFTILDMDDQIRLLKQLLRAADIDEKRWPARALSNVIQRWKDRGLTPGKVTAAEVSEFAGGKALSLYHTYQERLKVLNAVDFGDLLLHCLTLFSRHADVLDRYQRLFRYILVDEYQDTNVAQYLWLRLLAQAHGNLCCVGDDDQSIYGWRGAEVGNILRFEKDFPGAQVIRLERNYRSTGHILGAASALIAHNEERLGKTLWTETGEGEKIKVSGVWDGEEEARAIGDEIEALQRQKISLDQMAVLVRAGFQTREFEERFIRIGVPYRVIGGPRFYERQEIRDAVAYLRVVAQPNDDLAFERIVNLPRRGIGDASLQAVHRLARASGVSLTQAAAEMVDTDEIGARARGALRSLLGDFDRWRRSLADESHVEVAQTILDESGYTVMWRNALSPDAPGRLENLKELISALEEYGSLPGFLEHVSLVMENDTNAAGERASVMTLHAAKGSEFDCVFLPGWEEGVFPNQRSLDEGGATALEEERRLAHVGITRARERVYISFAANRRIFNQWKSGIPSRFLDELPPEHVESLTEPGLYAGGGRQSESGFEDGSRPYRHNHSAFPQRRRKYGSRSHETGGKGMVIEGKAAAVASSGQGKGGWAVGVRVFHQKFGYGRIAAVEGNKLEISFDKAGIKKVIDRFIEPV
jgi:DNA helicase-2/ATP-dependent DNA helicase PcrA